MGADIWIHVEHKPKDASWYAYGREFCVRRFYPLFGFMAGARSQYEPLFAPRGLPGDMSRTTCRKYKYGIPDFHTPSWLTVQEFKQCIDCAKAIAAAEGLCFSADYNPFEDYDMVYGYMERFDASGKDCRIVFWFDN